MLQHITAIREWWYRGAKPAGGWRVYLYYHITLALLLGVWAVLDSRHCFPRDYLARLPRGADFVAHVAFNIILGQAVLLSMIAPFLSARLLWLARKGSPSFVAFAVCDTLATFQQWLALLIAVS